MNPAALLLADRSPCLRRMVLIELLEVPADDPEVLELTRMRDSDPLASGILQSIRADGSCKPGSYPGSRASLSTQRATAFALTRLGYLGYESSHPLVARAAEYLFSRQLSDGSWPLAEEDTLLDGNTETPRSERYNMIPLQTAFPLKGLAACGYARDPRAERAYEWLLAQRLPDGAWPTGTAAGVYGRVGGYRRLAHSMWGCRTSTTASLSCLALHPDRCRGDEAKRALDLLLGNETRDVNGMGVEVARMIGVEEMRGTFTYFARFDLALLLDLCARTGASLEDARVRSLVEFITSTQGEYGLWEISARPHASRWVSFDLLRSLKRLEKSSETWLGTEPSTPFRAYPRRDKRF